MDVDKILETYNLERDTASEYIISITRSNQSDTADEIGVSRQTINRYKSAFSEMNAQERLLLISSLTQEKLLEQATE